MRWIGWLLLAACFHMAYVLRLSAGILADALGKEFALMASTFGVMSSMVFYAYTFMQIPVGILADTRGPRFTVSWGMAVAGTGALVFASSGSPAMLFLGRAFMGIGVAGAFVCTMKFLSDNFEGDRFATLSGITSFIGNAGGMTAQAPSRCSLRSSRGVRPSSFLEAFPSSSRFSAWPSSRKLKNVHSPFPRSCRG